MVNPYLTVAVLMCFGLILNVERYLWEMQNIPKSRAATKHRFGSCATYVGFLLMLRGKKGWACSRSALEIHQTCGDG